MIALLCCLCGCSQSVQQLAATAGSAAGEAAGASAPPALVKGLAAVEQPENQRRLHAFATSPAVQETSRAVGEGLGRGIVERAFATVVGVPATRPAGSVGPPGETGFGPDAAAFVRQTVAPLAADVTRSAVGAGVQAATDPDAQAGARSVAEAAGEGAVRGAARAARENAPAWAEAIRDQFGPAVGDAVRRQMGLILGELWRDHLSGGLHDLLEKEVAPVVRRMWEQAAADVLVIPTRPDVSPAVIENARNVSRGAGSVTHDSLVEIGVVSEAGKLTGTSKALLWGLILVVGMVGMAAAVFVVVLVMAAVELRRRGSPAVAKSPGT